jgi:hypothetical protein
VTGLPENRTAFFDAAGPVESVLSHVARDVPHIFPEVSEHLVRSLTLLVHHQAKEQNWDNIMLWVASGMGEDAFGVILEQLAGAQQGGVVVNPDILNGDAKFFDTVDAAMAARDSLLATNEIGHDVMVILAGSEGIDRQREMQLLGTRLRIMDMSFEMLRDDLSHDPRLLQNPELLQKNLHLLNFAYRHIGEMSDMLEFAVANQLKLDAKQFSLSAKESAKQLNHVMLTGIGIVLMDNVKGLVRVLYAIPDQFPHLGMAPVIAPLAAAAAPDQDLLLRLNQEEMQPGLRKK